ncbi:MAG: helix-turn-helix domain-containing protein [Planctomycetes bacterium]|nr:helix-turn-helix domain-containing protein [Planctomycetota bacterium]
MGRMPDDLRAIIAHNIRVCRCERYPGRGGAKSCAEDFGVSPQQWSPWENGRRTPDELRLQQLAAFFNVTVEYLRTDHTSPATTVHTTRDAEKTTPDNAALSAPGCQGNQRIPGIDIPPEPAWQPDPPGSPASFFWLARYYIEKVVTNGVRLDKQCLDYIVEALRR